MFVRKAKIEDIPKLLDLLNQVKDVHAKLRPDIFISGTTKYNAEQLKQFIEEDELQIYVAVNDNGEVVGHLFFEIKNPPSGTKQSALFIEDLCVDEKARRTHVGEALFEFAKKEAKRQKCNAITLAVWEGNIPAKAFYGKMNMRPKLTMMEYIIE